MELFVSPLGRLGLLGDGLLDEATALVCRPAGDVHGLALQSRLKLLYALELDLHVPILVELDLRFVGLPVASRRRVEIPGPRVPGQGHGHLRM